MSLPSYTARVAAAGSGQAARNTPSKQASTSDMRGVRRAVPTIAPQPITTAAAGTTLATPSAAAQGMTVTSPTSLTFSGQRWHPSQQAQQAAMSAAHVAQAAQVAQPAQNAQVTVMRQISQGTAPSLGTGLQPASPVGSAATNRPPSQPPPLFRPTVQTNGPSRAYSQPPPQQPLPPAVDMLAGAPVVGMPKSARDGASPRTTSLILPAPAIGPSSGSLDCTLATLDRTRLQLPVDSLAGRLATNEVVSDSHIVEDRRLDIRRAPQLASADFSGLQQGLEAQRQTLAGIVEQLPTEGIKAALEALRQSFTDLQAQQELQARALREYLMEFHQQREELSQLRIRVEGKPPDPADIGSNIIDSSLVAKLAAESTECRAAIEALNTKFERELQHLHQADEIHSESFATLRQLSEQHQKVDLHQVRERADEAVAATDKLSKDLNIVSLRGEHIRDEVLQALAPINDPVWGVEQAIASASTSINDPMAGVEQARSVGHTGSDVRATAPGSNSSSPVPVLTTRDSPSSFQGVVQNTGQLFGSGGAA